MNYRFYLILIIVGISHIGNSQTHNPRLWYLGYQSPLRDTNTVDTGYFLEAGSSVLDFRTTPLTKSRVGNSLSIEDCNAFIFDERDSLVLYSNGSKVFNHKHRLIEGADSINYGAVDWTTGPFVGNYYGAHYIGLFNQAITILPIPNHKNKYALVSIYINGDEDTFKKITYSVIDMSLNNGLGKMTIKEQTVALGDYTESINAVRHANGQDWWLIAREYSKKCYTIFLLDSSGIKVVSRNQCENFDLSDYTASNRQAICRFSPNGKLFIALSHKGVELYNFDRCSGVLSNKRIIQTNDTTSYLISAVFSPNNKYVYLNNYKFIYQVNLTSFQSIRVAEYDGFKDSFGQIPLYTSFRISQLSSDNKIYYSTSDFTHYLHCIENPDVVGLGCNVVQRAVKIQTLNSGIPHFPNFELGVDSCWTNSIENIVKANVEVFPNPASEYLQLDLKNRNLSIEIYDLLGKLVLKEINILGTINISKLNQGSYYYKIVDTKGTILRNDKIVVIR